MNYLNGQVQQSLNARDYQVIICVFGTRGWNDKKKFHQHIVETLEAIPEGVDVLFLSGGASSGADDLIIRWCKHYKFPCLIMYADWDQYPRAAGFIRNEAMSHILTQGLGFHDGKSNGTQHMIDQCLEKGHPVKVVTIDLTPPPRITDKLKSEAH